MIKRNYEKGYHDNLFYREVENSQRNHARLSLILDHKQGGRLLEIGCGMGGFLKLAESEFDVEGIDISHSAVRSLHNHFGCKVRAYNIEDWPAPKCHYDVIAAFNTLEHLENPEVVIEKMRSALNDDGLVIGSVPNNSGILGRIVTRLGNYFDRTHISVYTPKKWRRIFREAGFKTVHFFGELTLGRNRAIYVRNQDWHNMSFNLMFLCSKNGIPKST